jgi:hypothetical protein
MGKTFKDSKFLKQDRNDFGTGAKGGKNFRKNAEKKSLRNNFSSFINLDDEN